MKGLRNVIINKPSVAKPVARKVFIDIGYVHPATRQWHSKRFDSVVDADKARDAILRKGIPCARLSSATHEFTVYGCTEDSFMSLFISMGGDWDIDDDGDLVHAIYRKIMDGAENDRVTICGHVYTIKDETIRQDEQWAAIYNVYSGYDKVGTYSLYDANDEDVICFYWQL